MSPVTSSYSQPIYQSKATYLLVIGILSPLHYISSTVAITTERKLSFTNFKGTTQRRQPVGCEEDSFKDGKGSSFLSSQYPEAEAIRFFF